MRRKVIVLILAMVMTITSGGTAYASEKSGDVAQSSETAEADPKEKSDGTAGCEAGEHDLKEISRQEATEEKNGFILYACQRDGCDYQEKVELPAKETEDSGDEKEDKNSEEINPERDETAGSETEDKNETAEKESETREEQKKSSEEDLKEKNADSHGIAGKTESEKTETQELSEEDIDEESASFAYATSSEVVAEYDPTTAAGTRKIVRNPENPASAEEVEGMAVPEGIVKVQRDAYGNITDLAVSNTLEEIRNGFSFSSETKTLHSISIVNEKDSSKNWITLTAKKNASELGIRIKQTADGMAVTMTENEKPVRIVKADSDEAKITLVTSTGGNCAISKHIQDLNLSQKCRDLKDINQILFHDMDGQKPPVELTTVKEFSSEKDKKTKSGEEKLYWLQQYDDESQAPIVITIYEQ